MINRSGPNFDQQNPNYGKIRTQVHADKQLIALKQDQNSSNTIMCRILSELENLAFFCGYNGPRLFDYYATKPKNFQDIINQILFQMTIFESSYNNFKKHNPKKQYEYPDNLNFMKISSIINNWKLALNNNASYAPYENYFNEFLNIISDNNLSKSFNKQFLNIDKNSSKMTNAELRRVMNAGATAICYTNEKYDDIEKEILENKDYRVNVILGGERKDNKFYNNMDNYDNKLESLKEDLHKEIELMIGYLELYVLVNAKNNHKIKKKYSKNINVKKNENIYELYSFYLNKAYNTYEIIYKEFSYTLPEQESKMFVNDILLMKSNTNVLGVKKECDNAINLIDNFISYFPD